MKKISKLLMAVALGGTLLISACGGSGYYVSAQLDEPAYERPVSPYADGVWIGGDWNWSGGRYVYQQGHWEHGRAGHTYVAGNWEQGSRGYRWHRGHWN